MIEKGFLLMMWRWGVRSVVGWFGGLVISCALIGDAPHVVIIQGEPEYGSTRSMPELARTMEAKLGVRTTLLRASRQEPSELPDLSILDEADLLVLFIRFRLASESQFETLKSWFDQGKPAIAFRTTSHGFWEDKGWFVPFFGGHYKAHAPNHEGTLVSIATDQREHPILRGVDASFEIGHGGTYNAQPLSDFVTPLLFGKTGELPAEPVAWVAEYRPRQRLFYTSLGAEDNFEVGAFRNLILNAAQWSLGGKVPQGGVLERRVVRAERRDVAIPSVPDAGSKASPLLSKGGDLSAWRHWDPSVEPRAIGLDERADTTSGGPRYDLARWNRKGQSVVARPGFGDIVTRQSFGDGVYRVDFLIPDEPRDVPAKFKGNSGVFIDGKWEIQIIDSFGASQVDDKMTCGALFGVAAPLVNACNAPGTWQSLEVTVQHRDGGAELSAWLNGRQIHDQVFVSEPTLYGFGSIGDEEEEEEDGGPSIPVVVFNEASSQRADLGKDYTAWMRFRTLDDGPLWGKANPLGEFENGDKALYVTGGRVHFQMGGKPVLTGRSEVDDGDWHEVVVRSHRGTVHLSVDGRVEGKSEALQSNDPEGRRVVLGHVAGDFPPDESGSSRWEGEIGAFKFFTSHRTDQSLKNAPASESALAWDSDEGVEIIGRQPGRDLEMGNPFTAVVRFRTEEDGPLFSKAPRRGPWAPDGKVLFLQDGRLVYDIGWVGAIGSEVPVADGEWHLAAVTHDRGHTRLYIDGRLVDEAEDLGRPDERDHVFKVGACASDFPEGGARHFPGDISHVGFLKKALSGTEVKALQPTKSEGENWTLWRRYELKEKTYRVFYRESAREEEDEEEGEGEGQERPEVAEGPLRLQADSAAVRFANLSVEPLGDIDHASIIRNWDDDALVRGQRVYDAICITCHGNLEKEGTLPTSRKFWEAEFKNGKDPYSLFQTLRTGFEQMPAFPFLSVQQRYDVIHFIREALVKPTNQSQYFDVTEDYLSSLPKGVSLTGTMTSEMLEYAKGPKYMRMDFGPMLDWTYQVGPDNIAYKAIALRLDDGPGGVSKGRAWQVFDHDTLRMAAGWSGDEFIDWKGIALDQSHGTHASIVGKVGFTNPVGPGWAHPETGRWEDPRFLGRDGKPYGPLPRDWAQFSGQYLHGNKVIVDYTVGDARVLELAGMERSDTNVVYTRTLNIGKSSYDLKLRLCPVDVSAVIAGNDHVTIEAVEGFQVATVPASATPANFKALVGRVDEGKLGFQAMVTAPPEALERYLTGGPPRFPDIVETKGINGGNDSAFEVDEIRYPDENPWNSWMRIGGFDFLPGAKRAAVATWLGDVWLVDGIDGRLERHRWKRICTGLFQPLGVRVVDGVIYVTCRDQIARLHDYNGDEEIDYIEAFNSDHQVTEHFHEFAMGLQTDEEGNFYYAKSARHAKTAVVPHHGTLLKVSPDGSTTEILAVGFRAANGVCLNPDGSFIVTDQEGHWNPKNRINYVRKGGFYGNMMGYHSVVDERDEAMEQPLCWITNAFDRSPGELLWVPETASWGALNGQLLNMSYGTGKVFLVPHEIVNGQAQGGMVSLGLEFPTGTMRGRFHPDNGQLYSTGMFAWAGNKHQDGGFYRIRYTGQPAYQVTHLKALNGGVELSFSDPLSSQTGRDAANYAVKIWSLKRTKNYGSRHYNERPLRISGAELSADRKRVLLKIPDLVPTWSMEIKVNVTGENGKPVERVIHNTIHHLQESALF